VGKTRLVAEAKTRAAAAGLRVLSARGAELEREFPFGAVRQLLESRAGEDVKHLFAGAAAPAGAILGIDGERDEPDTGTDPSFASLHGLYWLTVHLAELTPLLLTIDDVQWCDAPSLRFLAYLRPRLEGLRVLLLCSLRTADRGSRSPLVNTIVSDPSTVSIHPRPLSEAATAELIEKRLGEVPAAPFAAACHHATGGNPLLLSELLKVLQAEGVHPAVADPRVIGDLGPRSVSRTVLLRLSRLTAEAASVAQAIAVLGDGASVKAVAALAGLSEQHAAEAVAALARAEVVHAEAPLGFVHPLVAGAVYLDILPAQRELLHRRAAELLMELGTPAEQVAGHLLIAPPGIGEWAADVLTGAGRSALQKGAADSAVRYLTRALVEPTAQRRRGELLLELGRAEALTTGPAAAEHLREAYELTDDPRQRGMTAQLLGRALLFTGRVEEAAEVVRRVAGELPEEHEDLRQSLEAFVFFCVLFDTGKRDSLRRLERYRRLEVGPGVGAKMLAAVAAQAWVYACGPSDACSELSLAALAGGELTAADNGLIANCPVTNLTFADREEAVRWWEVALADAHRRGSLFSMCGVNLWRGHTMLKRGELLDAEELLTRCLADLDQWGYNEFQAHIYCDAHLAVVLKERGDLVRARRALERSRDPGGTDDGARYWLNSQIELLLAERRFEEAIAAADDYSRRFDGLVPNPMDAPWRSHKALALDQLGKRDEALELIEAELVLARAWGAPGTVSRSLRVLGTLKREHGLGQLEEAVAVVDGSPARLEHAKALGVYGATLRRARRPTDAREPLRRALEIAAACGADGLTQQARTELRAAGLRPRTTAIGGVASLTASERRIADLAAEGHTNREVAELVFVTPKTVEMHLGNIYRKLGVSSRRELPSAIAGQ
jgi:DNA-binding CsgD family transcriptional regulator